MTVLSSAHADEAAAWDAGVLGMLRAGSSSGGCTIDGIDVISIIDGCGDCACCAVSEHGSCCCCCCGGGDCDGGTDSPASMLCHRGHGAGDR